MYIQRNTLVVVKHTEGSCLAPLEMALMISRSDACKISACAEKSNTSNELREKYLIFFGIENPTSNETKTNSQKK